MLVSWEFKTVSAINLQSLQAFGLWKELLSALHSFFSSALSTSEGPIWNKWDALKTGKHYLNTVGNIPSRKTKIDGIPMMDFSSWIPLCDAPLNNRHNQLTGCLEGIFWKSWAGQSIWLFHMHPEKTYVSLVASTFVPLSKAHRNKMRFGSCVPYLYIESPRAIYLSQRDAFYRIIQFLCYAVWTVTQTSTVYFLPLSCSQYYLWLNYSSHMQHI